MLCHHALVWNKLMEEHLLANGYQVVWVSLMVCLCACVKRANRGYISDFLPVTGDTPANGDIPSVLLVLIGLYNPPRGR